jgi:hypothetical protein
VFAASIIKAMIIIALMMATASNPETSVNFYQTLRNNPEDGHLHTRRRRENLKFHQKNSCCGD